MPDHGHRPLLASLALIVFTLGGAACGPTMENYQIASSGPTGCAPAEIGIANQQVSGPTGSWTATCKGKTFQCSAVRSATTCNPAQ